MEQIMLCDSVVSITGFYDFYTGQMLTTRISHSIILGWYVPRLTLTSFFIISSTWLIHKFVPCLVLYRDVSCVIDEMIHQRLKIDFFHFSNYLTRKLRQQEIRWRSRWRPWRLYSSTSGEWTMSARLPAKIVKNAIRLFRFRTLSKNSWCGRKHSLYPSYCAERVRECSLRKARHLPMWWRGR